MEGVEKTKTFSELISSDKPVLVDFSAGWCGPCQMMEPILEELKRRMGDKLSVIKVDIDKSPLVASSFNVQGVPTLILFRNKEVKWRQSGLLATNYLEQIINQHL
ncbi:MAG TPA: thioredoxin [Chitinophagaceae bacterium]|jgi:thioredoxin 1|nr:thioredoxin [Chitinophagaceae bacterium]